MCGNNALGICGNDSMLTAVLLSWNHSRISHCCQRNALPPASTTSPRYIPWYQLIIEIQSTQYRLIFHILSGKVKKILIYVDWVDDTFGETTGRWFRCAAKPPFPTEVHQAAVLLIRIGPIVLKEGKDIRFINVRWFREPMPPGLSQHHNCYRSA